MKQLRSQGTGRHLPHEILAMGRKDMEALSAVLGIITVCLSYSNKYYI